MAASQPIKQFKGLLPVLDSKKPEVPFVVDGQNFLIHADGPISSLGRREILINAIRDPIGIHSFGINNNTRTLFLTRKEVLEYDNFNRQLIPLITFPEPHVTDIWPWTHAFVGNKEYFARKGIGLVEYDPTANTWQFISGPDVPANIVACCASYSRLVVLAEGLYAWSAIDDGANLTPSTTTGAGFQSLSIIGATEPDAALIVWKYSNGFLVYTTKGIVRGESVDAINPFRHRVISTRHIPLSAYTVIPLNESSQVLLTRAGFFTTDGGTGVQSESRSGVPIPYQPLMGEHFHRNIIPQLNIEQSGSVRLAVDHLQRRFSVSISLNSQLGIFSKAYILYLPATDDWGSFDNGHTAFTTVQFAPGADIVTSGLQHTHVDQNGSLWLFQGGSADLRHPTPSESIWIYDFRGEIEWPARNEFGTHRMPTVGYLKTVDTSRLGDPDVYNLQRIAQQVLSPTEFSFPDIPPEFSYTLWDVTDTGETEWDLGLTKWDLGLVPAQLRTVGEIQAGMTAVIAGPAIHISDPLNAYIEIGSFRFLSEKDIDYLSQFHSLAVSTLQGAIGETTEDWNNVAFTQETDWNDNGEITDTFEDWGFGSTAFNEYELSVRGTIDGENTWENQAATLEPVRIEGKTRYFSMNISGLYHLIRIDAMEPNHSFALKTMDLNMNLAGRLA